MTVSYEEAVREVEADIARRYARGDCSSSIGHSTLRALLSGPPEPSEEEVATLIDDAFSEHGFGAPFFAAKAVQALYRSRRNG